MLSLQDDGSALCDGLTRREWLRLGAIGFGGLSLPTLLANRACATRSGSFGRARSVIICGLTGGAPQHETWDPKPTAPAEVRGEFGVISSRTPGLQVGELMPRTSRLTDKIAVLRAVVTNDNAHSFFEFLQLKSIDLVLVYYQSLVYCRHMIIFFMKFH